MRIEALDRRALALGLSRGLTLTDARARVEGLAVAEANPFADLRLLERMGFLCDRLSPQVALDPPHGLLIDITGCAHLFGGEEGLRARALRLAASLGLSARGVIAGTPDAAAALARFSQVSCVAPGGDEAAVRVLPVAALSGLSRDTLTGLARAGLRTIGDVAARAPEALAARFGAVFVARLRWTLGRENRRISPVRPVPDVVVDRAFAEPFSATDVLQSVLVELIDEAVALLEERALGGRRFEASFYRSDGDIRRLVVETGRASRDVAGIGKLFRERLEALACPLDPGFGFDQVRLSVPVVEPFLVVQEGLQGRGHTHEEVSGLVDQLTARFGRDRVLRFEMRASHEPERDQRLMPAQGGFPAAPQSRDAASADLASGRLVAPTRERGGPPLRPLSVFASPQPIEALAEVPDGPPLRFRWRRRVYEVARAEGPERIAPEWWRAGQDRDERDYYRIEDGAGARFWVFRLGFYGGTEAPRWFLHGVFA